MKCCILIVNGEQVCFQSLSGWWEGGASTLVARNAPTIGAVGAIHDAVSHVTLEPLTVLLVGWTPTTTHLYICAQTGPTESLTTCGRRQKLTGGESCMESGG